jgi:hypothetical protein
MKDQVLYRLYTTAEASVFTNVDKRKIKKEREHKILTSTKLSFSDLLYRYIIGCLDLDCSVPQRKSIKELVDKHNENPEQHHLLFNVIPCNLQACEDALIEVVSGFLAWKDDLHTDEEFGRKKKYVSGSAACIKDLLAAKSPTDQARLFSRYPELCEEDVSYAIMYKAAYPRG